jgi:hypothetical protein
MCLLLVRLTGAAAETNLVFSKTLTDGRKIAVLEVVAKEAREVSGGGLKLPPIVPRTLPYESIDLLVFLDAGLEKQLLWRRNQSRLSTSVAADAVDRLRFLDVDLNMDELAVLYSSSDVFVDRKRKATDFQEAPQTIRVRPQSSMNFLTHGRLVWLRELYLLGEVQAEQLSPAFYRIGHTNADLIYPAATGFLSR